MSDTLIKSDVVTTPYPELTEPGDHDRFSHIVRKDALEKAILEGVPCTAFCGHTWLPQRNPEKFPICPKCKEIYDSLPGDEVIR